MRNFFNMEGGFASIITRAFDTVVLGVLWMVCCIPIFTIGTSTAAFYYTYHKCVRQRRGYATQEFFASFKANFKKVTPMWLLILGVYLVAAVDFYILFAMWDEFSGASFVAQVILMVVILLTVWGLYLFPYCARFENKRKVIMRNCALIAIINLHWSVVLLALFALAVVAFLMFPVFNLLIPAIYICLANLILERVFKKYMSEEDLKKELEYENEHKIDIR